MHLHLTLSWIVLVIAWLKLLLLALHVKLLKWSFLVGVKVCDIKAGPPTPTTVLLYFQIMVSLGIPLLTEQFIVIEYPAVACIMPSSVSFWTAMFVGLSALNTKIKLLWPLMVGRFGWFKLINATFINRSVISWRSFLLVEDTEVLKENHRTAASHWRTISHNVVLSTLRHERWSNSQL